LRPVFAADAETVVDRIRHASAAGEHEEVHALAHRLLGGARTVHEDAVAEAALRLEQLTETDDVDADELEAAVARLLDAVAPVVEADVRPAATTDGPTGTPAATDAPLVVAIEDDPSSRILLERLFSRIDGVELVTAASGREGVERAADPRVALVLLDLNLPDADGEAVLRALANAEGRPQIAVVSAEASPLREETARALGASDYLVKPFAIPALTALVQQACARDARRRDENES
jgi:CheY-like chemotaxis protein